MGQPADNDKLIELEGSHNAIVERLVYHNGKFAYCSDCEDNNIQSVIAFTYQNNNIKYQIHDLSVISDAKEENDLQMLLYDGALTQNNELKALSRSQPILQSATLKQSEIL